MKVVVEEEDFLELLSLMKGMEELLVDMQELVLREVFRDMEGMVEDLQLVLLVLPATLREVEVVEEDILVQVLQQNQRMPMVVLVVVGYLVPLLFLLLLVLEEVEVEVDTVAHKMVRSRILVVVLGFLVGCLMVEREQVLEEQDLVVLVVLKELHQQAMGLIKDL